MQKIFTRILLLLILTISQISAQSIKGKLTENDQALSFANVMLHNAADSSLIKFNYSDDNGAFVFDLNSEGEFFIKVSFIGLNDYNSGLIKVGTTENYDLGVIELATVANALTEVVVTAKKPLMEVKADKIILNVANSVLAAGDDALSLLRKAPGVLVDNNENISLLGKSGVIIYIDNKPSPLSAAEVATMLKNMSSNDIESIEIISNPSAKYEAQGTAGIINIKTKRINTAGFNGSVNATLRQGLTTGANGGLNLNYKNEKINLFGTAGVFESNNLNHMEMNRSQNGLGFRTVNENRMNNKGINAKVGLDYYLSPKSTLGVLVNHSRNNFSGINNSMTQLGVENMLTLDSLLFNKGNHKDATNNSNVNLNYYYDNGKETTLNLDANYGQFNKNSNVFTPNIYTTPDESERLSTYIIRTLAPTNIHIANFKADFEKPLGKGKLTTGIKSSFVKTDNEFNLFNIIDNSDIRNEDLSNQFVYDEWVNAAYASYAGKYKKIGFNAGFRVENTYSRGELLTDQNVNNKLVTRKYLDIFPTAGLSYMPSEKHNFQLSYGKRINRPNYKDLNPFEFQLDQLTFEKGNAFLNPEYTHNIQLSHNYAYKLTTTFSYSQTKDVISRIIDTSGIKGSFITWLNLADRQVYTLSMSAPVSFTQKWSSYTNLNGVHALNNADFGDGKIINLKVTSFNMYHQQSYSFGKGWTSEISGWYTSPSIWEGSFVMESMWAAGAGVSKKFANGNSTVSLNIDDIFKTNEWSGKSNLGDLRLDINGGWDSRRVRLNFTYKFGQQSIKSRKRATGLEDEQKRLSTEN